MSARRQDWPDSRPRLDPAQLVFIDETCTKTNMMRTRGRAPRGQRLRIGRPHGHWKTSTFVAGHTLPKNDPFSHTTKSDPATAPGR